MTVKKETAIERFIGLSTDTKPTGVPVGSKFYEYNTRVYFVTHDGTNWVTMPPAIKEISVIKTLVQGTEPISANLFSFTGAFRLRTLWAVCTEAVDASDCDDAFFNIYDGTNVVDLSDDQSASGKTLTNITVGSVIGLNDAATVDMFYQKSDQCRYLAAQYAGSELWQRGLIIPKNGVTNYVRFTYDSAPASGIDIDLEFHIVYADISDVIPSALAAV
jgi:hypothetical protein